MTQKESTSDPRDYDYSNPERACDIIMKGGITSGVVYPHAVCELAQTYRFVNVGGTSAGAIAAAAAGAAELGRSSGGFKKLADLPDWLSRGTNLFSLFQPQPKTRRLFALVVASLGRGGTFRRVTLAALKAYWVAALVGALLGVVLIGLAVLSDNGAGLVFALVSAAVVAALGIGVAVVIELARDLGRVPENSFGLCTGLGDRNPPALTPWLTDLLDDLAGRRVDGAPVTFADLERGDVHLQLMTTNLTQRRPLRIPWARPESYFFDPVEFRRLFPERVVRHLEEHPPHPPDDDDDHHRNPGWWLQLCRLVEPLRPLPSPADLPIVVAARLSLSFPLLLSAVPLYAVDWSRTHNQAAKKAWCKWLGEHGDVEDGDDAPKARPLAEVCWFSDGGISSNFPLHFFDAPLPVRPTFAINLRGFHPDFPESSDESKNVYLPETSGGGLLEWWYRSPEKPGLPRLTWFGESIVRTMQNRVDEAQMRVPGYRDRVVHVGTSPSEGGMNLNMPSPVISALTARGREAARRLIERFAKPPADPRELSWDSHRWTRYRSSMAAITTLLQQVKRGYETRPEVATDRTYAQLLARPSGEQPHAYKFTDAQRQLGTAFTDAVIATAEVTEDALPTDLTAGAPRPQSEARIVPRA